jgi:hypothetical protein
MPAATGVIDALVHVPGDASLLANAPVPVCVSVGWALLVGHRVIVETGVQIGRAQTGQQPVAADECARSRRTALPAVGCRPERRRRASRER